MSKLQEMLGLNSEVNFIVGKPSDGKTVFLKALAASIILEKGEGLCCLYKHFEGPTSDFNFIEVINKSPRLPISMATYSGTDNKITSFDVTRTRDVPLYIFIDDIELITFDELIAVRQAVLRSPSTRVFATLNDDSDDRSLLKTYAEVFARNSCYRFSKVGVRRTNTKNGFKANKHNFTLSEEHGLPFLTEASKYPNGVIDYEGVYKETYKLLKGLIDYNEKFILPSRKTRIESCPGMSVETTMKEYCTLGLILPRQVGKTVFATIELAKEIKKSFVILHDNQQKRAMEVALGNSDSCEIFTYHEYIKDGSYMTYLPSYIFIDDSSVYSKEELDDIFKTVYRETGLEATVVLM